MDVFKGYYDMSCWQYDPNHGMFIMANGTGSNIYSYFKHNKNKDDNNKYYSG